MENDPKVENDVSLSPRLEEKIDYSSSWWANWKKNIVDDTNAPELYSQQAIWGFSFLMAPIYGSILMSMNFKRIDKTKFILPVIVFGILWYALAVIILPEKSQTSTVYLFNMVGGSILIYFVWPKFIGKEFKYRKRRILVPVIIAAVISAFFILAHFVAQ
jgi:hypothetical protein